MKTTGSRVGLGAEIRSLTHTESMSQRSQSSINSRTLSGDSLSNAPSPKAIPMRIFKGTPILIFPHRGGRKTHLRLAKSDLTVLIIVYSLCSLRDGGDIRGGRFLFVAARLLLCS